MSLIEQIKHPIQNEFAFFEKEFEQVFHAELLPLKEMLQQVGSKKGKQIRPLLTILSAKICDNVNKNTYLAATSLELLHTASLIHDDVIDNTTERRGVPSAMSMFGNKRSILLGDFLFSRSTNYMAQTRKIELIDCIVKLGETLTQGEIQQSSCSYRMTSEEEYFQIISKKTAVLFSLCATAGALSANADSTTISALNEYGNCLGIMFQLKDDVFDYTPGNKTGKPAINDVKEGKLTLPIIHALNNGSLDEQNMVFGIMNRKEFSDEDTNNLLDFIAKYNGIDYTHQAMLNYQQKALSAISIFQNSELKSSLMLMLDFVMNRKS